MLPADLACPSLNGAILQLHRWPVSYVCVCAVGLLCPLSILLAFSSSTPFLHSSLLHSFLYSNLLPSFQSREAPTHPPFTPLAETHLSSASAFAKRENGSSKDLLPFHGAPLEELRTRGASPPPALLFSASPPPTSVQAYDPPIFLLSASPLLTPPQASPPLPRSNSVTTCDMSVGQWVQDGSHYPLYQPGSCPFVDEGFNCQGNGRPDSDYLKWRWKPRECDLPRFNARKILEKLRGKRMVFAGDSLMRNQWESMLCLLREGLDDKSRMVEMKGNRVTKGRGAYVFKFLDYNTRVEFYRSHFLVAEGRNGRNRAGRPKMTVRLDTVDRTSGKWLNADVLVITTGHWWSHGKTARGKDYFQEGKTIYGKLSVEEAFRRAMNTLGSWIDKNVNAKRTKIFFSGYSPAHFKGGEWNSGGHCNKESEPIFNESFIPSYPEKMLVIEDTVRRMKNPVKILNVTRLSGFRKDAHPSVFGQAPRGQSSMGRGGGRRPRHDCSHWCLPGLPDIWNEVMLAFL